MSADPNAVSIVVRMLAAQNLLLTALRRGFGPDLSLAWSLMKAGRSDAALTYFQTFSRMPIPAQYERPAHPLDYYQRIRCPADVTKPRCPDVP